MICRGGGISGLTLAVALIKRTRETDQYIHVDLYESANELTEIGAGITVLRRPWNVLRALGLSEGLSKLCDIPDADSRST